MNPISCPLSNPDLGIVSEQDHFNNQCICHLCTCQRHLCPNNRTKFQLQSTFVSHYKRQFARFKTPAPPQRPPTLQHRPTTQKMDLTTTNMELYKHTGSDAKLARARAPERPKTTRSCPRFVGQSQYKNDFLNWGPHYPATTKRPVHPVHAPDLQFRPQTTYTDQFYSKEPVENKVRQPAPALKTESYETSYLTTAQRQFQNKSAAAAVKVQVKPPTYEPLKYSVSSFRSECRQSYQSAPRLVIDPHMLRRML